MYGEDQAVQVRISEQSLGRIVEIGHAIDAEIDNIDQRVKSLQMERDELVRIRQSSIGDLTPSIIRSGQTGVGSMTEKAARTTAIR